MTTYNHDKLIERLKSIVTVTNILNHKKVHAEKLPLYTFDKTRTLGIYFPIILDFHESEDELVGSLTTMILEGFNRGLEKELAQNNATSFGVGDTFEIIHYPPNTDSEMPFDKTRYTDADIYTFEIKFAVK